MPSMSSLLIHSVYKDSEIVDVLIQNGVFKKISTHIPLNSLDTDTKIVDASQKAILPAFYNAHTHAAMTLLRGYADDMSLFKWLHEYIWVQESKLQKEDIYWASRLAILEMIHSGTVFFADMYWHREETIRAVIESGVKATIGVTFAENLMDKNAIEKNFDFLKEMKSVHPRIKLAVMPHSIYAVESDLWKRCAREARNLGLVLHSHISETKEEVETCLKKTGLRPVEYLESLGVLDENVVLAHAVHLNEKEIQILKKRKVSLVHCPVSNMKLSSGKLNMKALQKVQISVALGTDGAASNNNLDMLEEMKIAALLAKTEGDPEVLNAKEAFSMASLAGAKAYQWNAGEIKETQDADAILVDLNNERMLPMHHLHSNWVYSADSRAIHQVICNGKPLIENKKVKDEDLILENIRRVHHDLKNRH